MTARLRIPRRDQIEMRAESLDQLLPPEHPARAVWQFVCGLDLTAWTGAIRSRPSQAGAPAFDPRLLVALWLLATLDGVSSARELSALCEAPLAYRWLCGDEPVNHHTLSDFRVSDAAALAGLLTQSAAALLHAGLADLTRVAQDGVRVRASAGTSSFRREKTLRECLAAAARPVEALSNDDDGDAGAASRRQQAARLRAAKERQARLEAALVNWDELQALNAARRADKRKEPSELRVSMTDPEARKMKMADGGFRPAYNVQFTTTTAGGVVVDVGVTQEGCDNNQLLPMLDRVEQQYGQVPAEALVDGGYVDRAQIETAETERGVRVFAPVKEERDYVAAGKDPFARRVHDTAGTAAWRARMGTAAAKAIYRWRARTAEWVNALARNRGLVQFRVRGVAKVRSASLWSALTHNFGRSVALRTAPAL